MDQAQDHAQGPRDFAVVVGISKYDHPEFPRLGGARNDALEFVKWLRQGEGHLEESQIITRLSEATYADLSRAFSKLIESVDRGNGGRRLYIFVAGHGAGESLKDAYLYSSEHSRYINGCWDIIRAAETLRYSGLFREIVLFMDCCRTRTGVRGRRITIKIKGKGLAARHFYCCACLATESAGEKAFAHKRRGIFSLHLIQALAGRAGGAVDHQGQVTAQSLTRYLKSLTLGSTPDFDPKEDHQDLRTLILASGFRPRRRPLEIRLRNPSDTFGLLHGLTLKPLSWKRTRTGVGTFTIEREEECAVLVTVPDVSDVDAAIRQKAVHPDKPVVEI